MPTAAIARSILTPSGVWRVVAQSLLAILALAAVTLICARLQPADPQLTSAALLYLVIVVLLSLNGSFASAAIVSLVAVAFLEDLAAPPLLSLSFDEPLDLVAPPVFLTTALVITRLVSKMRGSLQKLRTSLEDLHQAQTQLAHVTRVTTLGELAASIAHEVNQPLTAIVADANAALNWLAPVNPDLGRVRETLAAIAKDGVRAAEVLIRIRNMLSRSAQPHEPCNLDVVIREALPLVRSEFARHAIRVQTSLATDLPAVMGDCIQLQQVLLNLLINAVEASKDVVPERRRVTVCATVKRGEQRTCAVVEVRDAGVGIRESEFARLFDAFYSSKPNGLGMGLSISRAIIERHGGRLWGKANPDYGATFYFSLPALT